MLFCLFKVQVDAGLWGVVYEVYWLITLFVVLTLTIFCLLGREETLMSVMFPPDAVWKAAVAWWRDWKWFCQFGAFITGVILFLPLFCGQVLPFVRCFCRKNSTAVPAFTWNPVARALVFYQLVQDDAVVGTAFDSTRGALSCIVADTDSVDITFQPAIRSWRLSVCISNADITHIFQNWIFPAFL